MYRSLDPGAIGVSAPFEQSLAWAKEFGFEGVSVPVHTAMETGPEAFRDLLAKHNLKPSVFGLSVDYRNDDGAFEATIAEFPAEVRAAAAVGLVRCSTWVLPGKKGMSDSDYFSELETRLSQCAKILGDHGIRLGLEFIGPKTLRDDLGLEGEGLSTADRMLELIDAIGLPGTGLLLDAWHWYTSHGTPELFDRLTNDLVVDVHVNDAPKGIPVDEQVDNKRCLPGSTDVMDLQSFFAGLRKIGYDGPVTVEPFSAELNAMEDREAVKATADALKRFV